MVSVTLLYGNACQSNRNRTTTALNFSFFPCVIVIHLHIFLFAVDNRWENHNLRIRRRRCFRFDQIQWVHKFNKTRKKHRSCTRIILLCGASHHPHTHTHARTHTQRLPFTWVRYIWSPFQSACSIYSHVKHSPACLLTAEHKVFTIRWIIDFA